MSAAQGSKHDTGKPRLGLIDRTFLWGLASVLTFGARKYAAHNWRKGLEADRLYDALLRHLTAWMDGEDLDQESGLHHLDHAACELMFLRWTIEKRRDLDNRWRPVMLEGTDCWSHHCKTHGTTLGTDLSKIPYCEACMKEPLKEVLKEVCLEALDRADREQIAAPSRESAIENRRP